MFTAADFLHNNTSSKRILFLKFTTPDLDSSCIYAIRKQPVA